MDATNNANLEGRRAELADRVERNELDGLSRGDFIAVGIEPPLELTRPAELEHAPVDVPASPPPSTPNLPAPARLDAFAPGGTYRKWIDYPVRNEQQQIVAFRPVWVDFRHLNAGDMEAIQDAQLIVEKGEDGEPTLRQSMGASKRAMVARSFVAWEIPGEPLTLAELAYLDPVVLDNLFSAVDSPVGGGPLLKGLRDSISSSSRPTTTPTAGK